MGIPEDLDSGLPYFAPSTLPILPVSIAFPFSSFTSPLGRNPKETLYPLTKFLSLYPLTKTLFSLSEGGTTYSEQTTPSTSPWVVHLSYA